MTLTHQPEHYIPRYASSDVKLRDPPIVDPVPVSLLLVSWRLFL